MKFSFIMPVYNVQKYLNEAIDSVLRQKDGDLELILVDDGSTDDSGRICDAYQGLDPRIKVIHKENGGLSDARNKGIETASGEYIIFIDSDDVISDKLLYWVNRLISEDDPDLIQYKFKRFIDGKEIPIEESSYKKSHFSKDEIYGAYVKEFITREAWNKVYKRSLLEQIRFPNGRLAEDLATTYKVIKECSKVVCLDAYLYYYRVRESGIMSTGSTRLFYDAMKAHEEIYIQNETPEFCNLLYSNYYNNLLKIFAKVRVEHIDDYLIDIESRIDKITGNKLVFKSRIVHFAFELFPDLILKFVYSKYVKGKKT